MPPTRLDVQPTGAMSAGRKRVITVAIAVFVLASASGLVTKEQHWPVISFPMFSFNTVDGLECPVVFGVPEDATKPEFRIAPRQTGTAFLTLPFVFAKVLRYPYRNPGYAELAQGCPTDEAARQACAAVRLAQRDLQFLYERYEKIRQQNKNPKEMPPIRALRLYDLRFQFGKTTYDVTSKELRAEWSSGQESQTP